MTGIFGREKIHFSLEFGLMVKANTEEAKRQLLSKLNSEKEHKVASTITKTLGTQIHWGTQMNTTICPRRRGTSCEPQLSSNWCPWLCSLPVSCRFTGSTKHTF